MRLVAAGADLRLAKEVVALQRRSDCFQQYTITPPTAGVLQREPEYSLSFLTLVNDRISDFVASFRISSQATKRHRHGDLVS
jgi:hypothetical protein